MSALCKSTMLACSQSRCRFEMVYVSLLNAFYSELALDRLWAFTDSKQFWDQLRYLDVMP